MHRSTKTPVTPSQAQENFKELTNKESDLIKLVETDDIDGMLKKINENPQFKTYDFMMACSKCSDEKKRHALYQRVLSRFALLYYPAPDPRTEVRSGLSIQNINVIFVRMKLAELYHACQAKNIKLALDNLKKIPISYPKHYKSPAADLSLFLNNQIIDMSYPEIQKAFVALAVEESVDTTVLLFWAKALNDAYNLNKVNLLPYEVVMLLCRAIKQQNDCKEAWTILLQILCNMICVMRNNNDLTLKQNANQNKLLDELICTYPEEFSNIIETARNMIKDCHVQLEGYENNYAINILELKLLRFQSNKLAAITSMAMLSELDAKNNGIESDERFALSDKLASSSPNQETKGKRNRDSDEHALSALCNAVEDDLPDGNPTEIKKHKGAKVNFRKKFKDDTNKAMKSGQSTRLNRIQDLIQEYENASLADKKACQKSYVRLLVGKGNCIANSNGFDDVYKQTELGNILTSVNQFDASILQQTKQTDKYNELKATFQALYKRSLNKSSGDNGIRFFQSTQPSEAGTSRNNADYQYSISKK